MSSISVQPSQKASAQVEPISSGIPGLDVLLGGGLMPGRAYQVRGRPGTGKTILGWHFLTLSNRNVPDGVDTDQAPSKSDTPENESGEDSLLISFDESEEQLRADAEQFGFDLDAVSILDLSPTSQRFLDQGNPDSFHSDSALDLNSIAHEITERVDQIDPSRLVVDSMTHFRQFVADPAQQRNQTLSFLRYLKEGDATVLLLSEGRSEGQIDREEKLHYLCDGIIEVERGSSGRTIQVLKQRGQGFREESHPMSIGPGGIKVSPKLNPPVQKDEEVGKPLSSGVPELDELLGGGIERKTVSMFSGPSGVGKTTLGLQFMKEAAGRGERSILYSFEEAENTLLHRSKMINIPIEEMIERGTLAIRQYRPWSFDPGVFVDQIREDVQEGAQIVMLDSLSSYRECGTPERMRAQLHRLCKYLVGRGVTVILINEIQSITGSFKVTEGGISHLADNLLFLRYLEIQGELRKAIGVLKKRAGNFEKSLREFRISQYGIRVGEPLSNLRGVLTGNPEWVGTRSENGRPMQ